MYQQQAAWVDESPRRKLEERETCFNVLKLRFLYTVSNMFCFCVYVSYFFCLIAFGA